MKIHIVQKGDTLWEIAKKYDVDFEEVKQLNTQFSSPDMIMPGMKVKIPSSTKTVKKEMQMKEKEKQKPKAAHPFKEMTPKPLPVIYEDDHKKPKEVKPEMPKIPAEGNPVPHIPKKPMPPMPQMPYMPYMPEKPMPHMPHVPEKPASCVPPMPEMPMQKHMKEKHLQPCTTINIPAMPQYIPPVAAVPPKEETMPGAQPQMQYVPVCCCQHTVPPYGHGVHDGLQYAPYYTGHIHGGYETGYHQPMHHTPMNYQPAAFAHMQHDFPSPCMEMPEGPVYHPSYESDCGCWEPEYPAGFPQHLYRMEDVQQEDTPFHPEYQTQEQINHLYPPYTEDMPQYPTPPNYANFSDYDEREETEQIEQTDETDGE